MEEGNGSSNHRGTTHDAGVSLPVVGGGQIASIGADTKMRRSDRIVIHDGACRAMLATRTTYPSEARRAAASASHLFKVSDAPGLVRYAMYRGLDELTLVELSQWSNRASRHEYADRVHASASTAGHADWRHVCDEPYRMFLGAADEPPTCIVIERQRLRRADRRIACEWIDTIITTLERYSPDGLCAATFFVSTGGDLALTFVEWTSPDAHCRALQKTGVQFETTDDGERARPTHPGITAEHELGCYVLVANLESELIGGRDIARRPPAERERR